MPGNLGPKAQEGSTLDAHVKTNMKKKKYRVSKAPVQSFYDLGSPPVHQLIVKRHAISKKETLEGGGITSISSQPHLPRLRNSPGLQMETHLTRKMTDSTPETLYEIGWRIRDQCVNVKQLTEDENDQTPAVLNELQRFEVWAINLGLYHRGHSSFDYRCRDSPHVFSYALSLLHDLDRELQQCKEPSAMPLAILTPVMLL